MIKGNRVIIILMVLLVVISLCFCNMQSDKPDDSQKETVSQNGDSETEASLSQKAREALISDRQSSGTFVTKNCIYSIIEDSPPGSSGMRTYFAQFDHKGKQLSRHKTRGYMSGSLAAVNEQYLCYIDKDEKQEMFFLYLVPIRQTEHGETVLWDQQELIEKKKDIEDSEVYLMDSYLVYSICSLDDGSNVMRYSFEEKTSVSLFQSPKNDVVLSCVGEDIYVWTGYDMQKLYAIDIEKWTASEVYATDDDNPLWRGLSGRRDDVFFIAQEYYNTWFHNDYICYDIQKQEQKGILLRSEIKEFLLENHLFQTDRKTNRYDLWSDFPYGDRIYLILKLRQNKKIRLEGEDEGYTRKRVLEWIVLSFSMDEKMELSYEEAPSQYFAQYNAKEGFVKNPKGEFLEMIGDELYFSYPAAGSGGGEMCIAAYNFRVKKCREIQKDELLYQYFQKKWEYDALMY